MTVIPDGNTTKIPFDALLTEAESKDFSYSSASYLIRKIGINYAYAVKTLKTKSSSVETGKMLVVAPDYGDTEYRDLKSAKKEAQFIKRRVQSSALIGRRATKKNCLKLLSEPFSVMHFSMHAERDDKSPLNSRLVFDEHNSITIREI